MASSPPLKILLLGPAHPYRGGISDSQMAFAKALKKLNTRTELWTFTHLYPDFIFPGKTQYSKEKAPTELDIERKLHSYNPLKWSKIANEINQLKPDVVVFRYWTPLLSPSWCSIARKLNPSIKRIGFIDNWIAHESKPWDTFLNTRFERAMDCFQTLSSELTSQVKQVTDKAVWGKAHPLDDGLPNRVESKIAKSKLTIDDQANYILFFGLIRAYKGLDLLIEALSLIPKKKLLVVGEAYENIEKYAAIVSKYKLEDRVHFINHFVSKQEIVHYFSIADAVVLPYKKATQSGVSAMAYHFETPLVVTNHKGLSVPVLNDNTGVVCEPNPSSIAKAVIKATDQEQNKLYRSNMRKNKANYSWDAYAEEWIEFIKEK